MLKSVSDFHVMSKVRDGQMRLPGDPPTKQVQDSLIATVVQDTIELLRLHGFVVAAKVVDEDDPRLKVADLVLQRWVASTERQRSLVRDVTPQLGLLLDKLRAGELP